MPLQLLDVGWPLGLLWSATAIIVEIDWPFPSRNGYVMPIARAMAKGLSDTGGTKIFYPRANMTVVSPLRWPSAVEIFNRGPSYPDLCTGFAASA